MPSATVLVVGGGIVGLATAYRLKQRYPDLPVTVVEKESQVAQHQSGHNSGVLHSGIYYKPGSLKATNCRAGKLAMEQFCEAEGIAFERCGKVIVAIDQREVAALETIYQRGQANGVACELIDRFRLTQLEPHTAGIKAIHVPEAGIVDYAQVCRRLVQRIEETGGRIVTSAKVVGVEQRAGELLFRTTAGEFRANYAINCAGLYCDQVAAMAGALPTARIVPFRGEYYELSPGSQSLVKNLIYPVPDPAFPFLGVHFTRMIGGGVECGPNAVLAFAREGYSRWQLRPGELAGTLGYRGFRTLAARYWRTGMGEMWRSYNKGAFVKALQRLVPAIRKSDLRPAQAGVRAQAVLADGQIVDDFLIEESERFLHVLNAPSPAATASLNIGNHLVDMLASRLDS